MADNNQIIEFSLPGFVENFNLINNLLKLMKVKPEMFHPDVKVTSVYGVFPGCIWNSGRGSIGQMPYEEIFSITKDYNNNGISIRHTFTNSMLDDDALLDYYCNRVCQITESSMNGVNINMPALANYISKRYPKFYRLWSTTKFGDNSLDQINELSKDNLTVLYYSYNNNMTYLEKLQHPENIEILTSEACVENCPNRQKHYAMISRSQLIKPSEPFTCPYGCESYYYYDKAVNRKHFIQPKDIREVYLPLGINKFKINGRHDSPINLIENIVNYLCNPYGRDYIRNVLLNMHIENRPWFSENTNSLDKPTPNRENRN